MQTGSVGRRALEVDGLVMQQGYMYVRLSLFILISYHMINNSKKFSKGVLLESLNQREVLRLGLEKWVLRFIPYRLVLTPIFAEHIQSQSGPVRIQNTIIKEGKS